MIKLKNITKYYSSDTDVNLALKGINLEFEKGEFVVITGKSGSGKSTLLNVISGMDTYEDGELYYQGEETSYYDETDWEDYRRKRISFIYQSYNLIDSYTALENVEVVMTACEEGESKQLKRERRKRALEILDKVGLKKWANHKSAHMSSGQKQRLGIARALAKDTEVIVADEPTGNLDVENGLAVMKILHELSKEKLVIVVTHNFEQVKDFATRKIRLFDGEVAEDIPLNQAVGILKTEAEQTGESKRSQEAMDLKQQTLWQQCLINFKKAATMVHKNRKAQPHRTLFVFTLLFMAVAGFFVMYGYFISNLDDTSTREISDEVFCNSRKERLIVRKPDGSIFMDEDLQTIRGLKYISGVAPYDYANEISCLYEKDEDYIKEYKKSETTDGKELNVIPKDYSDFVSCASVLPKEYLTAGELPEDMYEVVVASEDKHLIGTKMEIYFAGKHWSTGTYFGGEFTITGIISPELKKPYFSEKLCSNLNINYATSNTQFFYKITKHTVYDDVSQEDLIRDANRSETVILVEGENLTGNQVRVAGAVALNLYPDGNRLVNGTQYTYLNTNAEFAEYYENGEKTEYNCEIVSDTHNGSASVLEVSHEFLEKIYGSGDITQVSVYLEHYAYTDAVISRLDAKGFEAASAYRMSAGAYDNGLVQEKMILFGICLGSIVMIAILSILVIYAMMKLKRKDFMILKSLGLKQRIIAMMNYYELITGIFWALFLVLAVAVLSKFIQIPMISEIVHYYTCFSGGVVIMLSLAVAVVSGYFFNRHMRKFLGGSK